MSETAKFSLDHGSPTVITGNASNDSSDIPKTKIYLLEISEDDSTCCKTRYSVVIMLFMMTFFINGLRTNTSVALIAMMNTTQRGSHVQNVNNSAECVFESSNHTDHSNTKEGEFNWSSTVQGYILGAGFLGYLLTLFPGGLLAQKFGGKKCAVWGIFISAASCLASPLAARGHSALLIVMQLLMGVGQGFMLPAYAILSSNWYPKNERGLLNSICVSGYSLGPAVGSFVSGVICQSSAFGGWPSAFYTFGTLSMIHGVWVLFQMHESPKSHPRITHSEMKYICQRQETDLPQKRPPTPWRKMLTSIPVYILILAYFSQTWIAAHVVLLYSPFSGMILKYSPKESGMYTAIALILATILCYLSSWISNWLLQKKVIGVDKLRKGCNFLSGACYSAGLLGVYFSGCDRNLINILSVFGLSFLGVGFGGAIITPMDMSPMFAGALISICTVLGSLSGFLFPLIVGIITNTEQTLEQWHKIFFLSIGVVMGVNILYSIFGSAEVQSWNFSEGYEKQSKDGPLKKDKSDDEMQDC